MAISNFIDGSGTLLILATIFCTRVAGVRGHADKMCIPAETEPSLKSSSCYPLVNFTRPFCQNYGITLPNYIYATPDDQIMYNDRANTDMEIVKRLGALKISQDFNVGVARLIKCGQAAIAIYCHDRFPSCDRTQSVAMKQKVCREPCLDVIRVCGKIYDALYKYLIMDSPNMKKKYRCELQPYRNAGDSPECYYYSLRTTFADAPPAPEWTAKADCLNLNGSSYHGNISVTASGIPCQSWTEQCPHRHTMNKTYPELNDAKNYCRNPQNSGQRPWCFTTDRNTRWEYCNIPRCTPVDGGYGNWSLNSTCNVTCGEGFGIWSRECNNPKPKYGGRNCSHLGDPVEYRPCSAKPCPVDGGYSNWTLSIPCDVSCGDGVEVWRRTCSNPEPKYNGRNCSGLGISTEFRNCSRTPCPIDGNYSNWTKSSPCSVTCGQGVELWTRQCDNPPGKYGGNCSSRGVAQENRHCEMKSCPVRVDYRMIGVIVAAVVFVIFVTCFIFFLRRCRKQGSPYYALLNFSSQNSRFSQDLTVNNTSEEVASSSQENGASENYQNLTDEGNPVPGFSRGVVLHRSNYINTRSTASWYNKLQLIPPLAMEWLRNAWGNVDQFGRHTYDVMQRVQHVISPYDKLQRTTEPSSAECQVPTSDNSYDTLERSAAVLLPSRCQDPSSTEDV